MAQAGLGEPKPRLLLLTERFHPEEFIINDLAAEWAARGFEVDVLTQAPSYPFGRIFPGYKNGLWSREDWKGLRVFRFFTITGYRDSLFLKLLNYFSFAVVGSVAAASMGRKYDRVFVYETGPLTMAVPAAFLRLIYKKHVTLWVQDVWPDMVYAYGFRKTRVLSFFLDRLVAWIYKHSDQIFVSCEGFRQRVSAYAPDKPVHYFPNWPTVSPQPTSAAGRVVLSGKFNFTFAGNVGRHQNLEVVIRGFALASRENDAIQLNIVGDGSDLENLKAIVRAENVKGVVFWGRKKQAEMPAYFGASDVLIVTLRDVPIFSLTVPAKFQAYLAFAKPIFCVMNGEVRRLVEKNAIGLCASPGDPLEIKAGFLKFYELRGGGMRAFSESSRALLDGVFNRKKIVDAMTDLVAKGQRGVVSQT